MKGINIYFVAELLHSEMVSSFSTRQKNQFPKKLSKQTFRLDFVKLGSKINTLFIFGRKNCRLFLCFVYCNTLSDFGLPFF